MFHGMPVLQKLRTLVSRAGVASPAPAASGFVLGTNIQQAVDVLDEEPTE